MDAGATADAVTRLLNRTTERYDAAAAISVRRARGSYRPGSDADGAVLLRGGRQRLLPTTPAVADVALLPGRWCACEG